MDKFSVALHDTHVFKKYCNVYVCKYTHTYIFFIFISNPFCKI